MNDITFLKQQGGVLPSLPNTDHVSALLTYIADADLPSGYSVTDRIKSYAQVESAEDDGITSDSEKWMIKALHHHITQFFRINPGATLYVGIFTPEVSTYDYNELKTMQNFAKGEIKQAGVYNPHAELAAADVIALQAVATALEGQYQPISSCILACDVTSVATLASGETLSATGRCNVSAIISQDGDGVAATLYDDVSAVGSVTDLGIILGMESKASVHESIGWVQKFPAGVSEPGFADGTLVKDTDSSVLDTLNTKRFVFLRKYIGLSDSYVNDSHTLDLLTSDYAHIEKVRTIDKAIRGMRVYLLPYLSSPVYVDPDSGQLRPDTVAFLETLAGKQLEDMERAGELSGYAAEIDPTQNVLSTSELEIILKQVGVGVLRKMKVKIGYTTSID